MKSAVTFRELDLDATAMDPAVDVSRLFCSHRVGG
jgi:hypothetical protein